MAERTRHVNDLLGKGRDRVPVAVQLRTYEGPMTARLLELADEHGWRWVDLGTTGGKLPPDVRLAGALVDLLPDQRTVRQLIERGVPTVRIGRWPHPDDAVVPAVMADRLAAARMAAEHFAERDFRHVSFVGRDPWSEDEATYEAFAARAEELGCRCHLLQESIDRLSAELTSDAEVLTHRREVFVRWIGEQPKPLGLLTFGDQPAALYCRWLVDAGFEVPQDVAVLGMNNSRFLCESAAVALSSVAFDGVAVAEAAVKLLADLIAGRKVKQHTVKVPPLGVVARQSTDVLAAEDPKVVKALRYMWDHVSENPSVDQVARHVGVSRRTIERAFQRELGRGINEEFQRRRLGESRQLLRQTDLPVGEIANVLGFSSRSYFSQAFRKAHDMSPAQYRRRHNATAGKHQPAPGTNRQQSPGRTAR